MLKNLQIQNYALIQQVGLDFNKGLTIITGETGAGKSILLGGLSLILGKRLQSGLLKNTAKKTIVEAQFNISNYDLESLFDAYDLDFENLTIIRREISTTGKSRAFINDTPVKLEALQSLTEKLIDIHSQHQTLELSERDFQFNLVDAVANNKADLQEYEKYFKLFKKLEKQLVIFKNQLNTAQNELEYKSFQLQELENLKLETINPEELEQQLKKLDNIEEIKLILTEANARINDDELGVFPALISLKNNFQKIADFAPEYKSIAERLESLHWEMQDISMEINSLSEQTDYNPEEKERLQSQFDQLQVVFIKHNIQNISALIALKNTLQNEVKDLSSLELQISQTENSLQKTLEKITKIASKLHKSRVEAAEKLVKQIENVLQKLSMKNTRLQITVNQVEKFVSNGKDELQFLVSSDAGKSFGSLKQIASGGELSRIMLAIKVILSRYKKLATIIFDEIDSGVSGEVAQNMADVLKFLGQNMQVIIITHLPQIAVAGDKHFKVYKTTSGAIETQVVELSKTERIKEIAEMIEGKSPSDSALQHAKHLLEK